MSDKMYYSYSTKTYSSKKREGGFFRKANRRFPVLKVGLVLIIGIVIALDALDVIVASVSDPEAKIAGAPMGRHVQIIEREITGKKLVALTFDDGPSSLTTPALLDVLSKRTVPATFFMLGKMASYNPEIVKRAKNEGHEIASHTMSHQNLNKLSNSEIKNEINSAKDTLNEILGYTPELLRPPYGNANDEVKDVAKTPLILWSVDSLDWKSRDAEKILETIDEEVYDGSIILMHDIYGSTVEAVPLVIDKLRDEGYEFVTVSELAKIRGVELEEGKIYYSLR